MAEIGKIDRQVSGLISTQSTLFARNPKLATGNPYPATRNSHHATRITQRATRLPDFKHHRSAGIPGGTTAEQEVTAAGHDNLFDSLNN